MKRTFFNSKGKDKQYIVIGCGRFGSSVAKKMCQLGNEVMVIDKDEDSIENIADIQSIFVQNGWTFITAICTALFFINHFPCATTLWTIKKETGSIKWTVFSALLPTVVGVVLCIVVNFVLKTICGII